ncbi:MAG: hypothetical protein VYC34_10370, partial [Planctomycetota bacterium]|nr:hypothetical protein [Planctomycetota bacterium]
MKPRLLSLPLVLTLCASDALAQHWTHDSGRSRQAVADSLAEPTPIALDGFECSTEWATDMFEYGGVYGSIFAVQEFDDGSGTALYAGGKFSVAGTEFASNIAKWDGARWSAVGEGLFEEVYALAVYDDGSGPALYAGGRLRPSFNEPLYGLARWDGENWSIVGGGLSGIVRSLCVYSDYLGEALYVGGTFTTAGGAPAGRIARWDGTAWSNLAGGASAGEINALIVHDPGDGAHLYAGGRFDNIGGVEANNIAKWNGLFWSPVGAGVNDAILALATYRTPSGSELVVGGEFTAAGGITAEGVARWTGVVWLPLGGGIMNPPNAARVRSLHVQREGSTDSLYVGGLFSRAGIGFVDNIARWDGAAWSSLDGGLDEARISTSLVGVFDIAALSAELGGGIVAAGNFTHAGTGAAASIAIWQDEEWAPTQQGLVFVEDIRDVASIEFESGKALVVGGEFFATTDPISENIAIWTGSDWVGVGTGLPARVRGVGSFDIGEGPRLVASLDEQIYLQPPTLNSSLAIWDGETWGPMGQFGVESGPSIELHMVNHADGPALYVTGCTWSGQPEGVFGSTARWNGETWSPLGGEVAGAGFQFVAFDDGDGEALFRAGRFQIAGSDGEYSLAKWDGDSWWPLSPYIFGDADFDHPRALAAADIGDGPALYAVGEFRRDGVIWHFARYRDHTWQPLSIFPEDEGRLAVVRL